MNRVVKRTVKWLSIGMLGAVLVCVVLWIWIHTGSGRSMAADFLSGFLSRGERTVKIAGLDFLLPKRLGFENLAVSDEKGQWLAVDDAFLKWDPWSLVRGRIHVLEVGARSISISHVPEAAPEASKGKPEASGGVPWNLPARISISSASVESFSIDEAVAGTAMNFRLGASLSQMEQTKQAVFSLEVERLDNPGGHARISASVNASARTLELNGQISDPAGGVVSTLAGRPVPVAVSISGEGPFSEWTGSVEGTAGDLGSLSLYLTLKEQGDVFRFTGNGEAGVLSELTGRPEPDLIKIAYDTDFSKKGVIHVHDFRLVHPGVKFISKGVFEQPGGTIDGVFSLSVQDLGGLTRRKESGISGGVEIEGKLGGTVKRPVLDTEVSGTGICAYDFAADRVTGKIRTVFDRGGVSGGVLDVKAETTGSGVVLPGGGPIPGDSVSVEADVRLNPDGAISGQGNAAIGSWFYTAFNGSLSSGREVEATGRLEARDLSVLSGLAGVPLGGASWMEFSIAGPSVESIIVRLKGSAEPELLTRLTGRFWPGGNLSLKGSVRLDENRKLYLTDAELG
ncbi:MAG TPA: hypothetical protein ENN79_14445, partial [Desulfobacteraceae bacterium]|nr:hypothetical protein [Desulfobacteraceae bacterium]